MILGILKNMTRNWRMFPFGLLFASASLSLLLAIAILLIGGSVLLATVAAWLSCSVVAALLCLGHALLTRADPAGDTDDEAEDVHSGHLPI
jgi:hypothetical protein